MRGGLFSKRIQNMKSVVNIADIIAAGTQNSDGFSRKQNQIKGGDTKMVIFIKVKEVRISDRFIASSI